MTQRISHTFQARRAMLRHLAPRYQQASPAQKTLLLDSFVEWTGYTRKYAIALLNHGEQDQQRIQRRRLPQYRPAAQQALYVAWKATHYVCAKRLLPSLPSLVALLEGHGHLQLTEEERRQLLAMSVSTAERFLRTQRKPRLHGLSATAPGPWRKAQTPVRMFSSWEENRPGFVEMDLVAHCGDHLDGSFLYTLTLTDLATGWTECIPLLEKSADAVLAALAQARTLFPFPLLGIETDGGSEFLNSELIAYCEQEQLTFTRGRPGVKNDQCHVEQKNGAVVREAVGCARLVGVQAYQQLREVYRALRLVVNYFQPSLKLQAKVPRGDRVRRVYDAAQTPLQRLLASGVLSKTLQRDLIERVGQIDPLALSEQLDILRHALLCEVHTIATDSEGEFVLPLLRFPLLACTSGPLPVSEEGPAQADHCEEPFPPERIQEDHSKSLLTERHLEEAVWEASQYSAQAQTMHVSLPSTSSSTTEEHEADHLALTTVEQAMAAYVQEMRATGRAPKTLRWHQTSLSAMLRYLRKQFHLTGVCSLSGTSLRTWLTELSIVPSARTGATRTVNTVAAYARFDACLLQLAGSARECIRNAFSARRRTQSRAVLAPSGGARGVCSSIACLPAPRLARRAKRRHDGAQSRHPLALAGHGTAGFRVVRFTPCGCGLRWRNGNGAWKKRTSSHLPLVGGWAARRERLSGSSPSHASLAAYGVRGTGPALAHRAASSSHQE